MAIVYSELLASKVCALLAKRKGFSKRKMFGGTAYMCLINGNMCCGVLKDDLIVRTGPERYEEALAMPDARPMGFTGRQIKEFVYVGSEGWSKDATLKKWVEMGVDYASSLPKKK